MHQESKLASLAALSAVAMLFATPVLADAVDPSAPAATMDQSQTSPGVTVAPIDEKIPSVSSDPMIEPTVTLGQEVWSSDGEELGKVTKINLDAAGKLESFYYDVGTILGMGGKTVMCEASDFSRNEDRIELDVDAETAKALPEIDI